MEKVLCFFVLAVCAANAATLPESRIVGALPSREGQFPYVVSIQQMSLSNENTRGHRCGGVLITPRHVLTSAACTYNFHPLNQSETEIVPTEFRVFGGAVNLTNSFSPEQFRVIVNITRHPGYTGLPMRVNNIAVLTLNNPFNSTVVAPLSIPHASFDPAEHSECVTAGWGSTSPNSNSPSAIQMFTRKLISNRDTCALLYNTLEYAPNILPSMICAAPYDRLSSACEGDAGNGLVCNGGLAGILSANTGCTANSLPEVYTRVANYTTWIRSVTGGASTFQPGLAALVLFTLAQLLTVKIIS